MKKIYRDNHVDEYWEERWRSAGVDNRAFENKDIYPIKYCDKVVNNCTNILEAGCGAGRLFFHYSSQGKNIVGIDYSRTAIENIRSKDPTANVTHASILNLPFKDQYFDCVLSFGLYHGIENIEDIDRAFYETARVLKPNGKLVFSVRLNGLENDITEYIYRKNNEKIPFTSFHKWEFDHEDIEYFADRNSFFVDKIFYVRNVSFLFKYNFFRARSMKKSRFVESEARSQGFKLNFLGRTIDNYLHKKFPKHFSNLIVVIATKR